MERSVAILYPGEMGCAVARVFVAAGWRACTHLWGPSLVCRDAAEAAGITDLPSLDEALSTADLVVSLVPPAVAVEAAEAVADAARRVTRRPLYLDANSVAPATVAAVAATVAGAGLDCVDGAFIGSAADLGGRTRLYLSGPRAADLAVAAPAALRATSLGSQVGRASALKMAFAGFNKGMVGLFLSVVDAASTAAASDELQTCLGDFYPGTVDTIARLLPSYPRHAGRRADEMDELARWLASEGRDPALAVAAGDVLRRFAALGLDAERAWTAADVVTAWTAAGRGGAATSGGDAGGAAQGINP